MNKLKELRQEKNLTQSELGKIFGVSKMTVLRWENGENQIKPEKAKMLADYFDVSVGYLLGYTNLGVGSRLKQLRLNSGLTIEKVCNDLKIEDLDYWKLWETQDNITFGKELAQEIADYFSVDVNYLLGKTNIVNTNFSSIEQNDKEFLYSKKFKDTIYTTENDEFLIKMGRLKLNNITYKSAPDLMYQASDDFLRMIAVAPEEYQLIITLWSLMNKEQRDSILNLLKTFEIGEK